MAFFKEPRHRFVGNAVVMEIWQPRASFDWLSAISLVVAIFSTSVFVEQLFPTIQTFQDPVWWSDKVNRVVAEPLHFHCFGT